jgi:hypothetical protein
MALIAFKVAEIFFIFDKLEILVYYNYVMASRLHNATIMPI